MLCCVISQYIISCHDVYKKLETAGYCHNVLCSSYPLQPYCILTSFERYTSVLVTVCYLFSTSLFMLSVERIARIFTCRPTIPYRLLCPECVLLCCHNVAGYRVLKKTRGNVTRFGHIVSRQRVFFSLRIIGKYPVIHLHIE